MNKIRLLEIERTAESVRDECNISDYGIKDIFEAADKLGYRTIRMPMGSDAFLGFALIKSSDRLIFSNSSQILAREIFTVAHEIGHQKLHLTEQEEQLIRDDVFTVNDEIEIEANHFAACLLMPFEKVQKYIRFELKDKPSDKWDGLDIARFQTTFNVSYDAALNRLHSLNIINELILEKLKKEKVEKTATKLLTVIQGNVALCKVSDVKRVPSEFLEWVISNYKNKLIPKKSADFALGYVDLKLEDINLNEEKKDEVDVSLDELIEGMD